MLDLNTIHEGDCLQLMRHIPDGSIDMILCDLPYGTTQNKWGSGHAAPSGAGGRSILIAVHD